MPSTEDLTDEKLIASCLFEETNATTVLMALIIIRIGNYPNLCFSATHFINLR